jgi:hypothetical protein
MLLTHPTHPFSPLPSQTLPGRSVGEPISGLVVACEQRGM